LSQVDFSNVQIGDRFKYNSTSINIDSFDFFVFNITPEHLEIIVNRDTSPIYKKISKKELLSDKVKKYE